jgi:hypothetical protein
VSPVSHYLWPTRPFSLTALASWHRIEEEAVLVDLVVTLTRREGQLLPLPHYDVLHAEEGPDELQVRVC